jgi:hypothetical protein
MSVGAVCGECGGPVVVKKGQRAGGAYYRCPACGVNVHAPVGSKAYGDLIALVAE